MIKIMNGKPVIVDEDGKTRVLFDNLPGDIGGTPGYDELLEDVQNLMDYVYGTDIYAENKTPYFFRPSGGGAEVGTIESPVLVGGSVGWNQLAPEYNGSTSASNVTLTKVADGKYSFSGTASATAIFGLSITGVVANHVYYVRGCPSGGSSNTYQLSFRHNSGSSIIGDEIGAGLIAKPSTITGSCVLYMRFVSGTNTSGLVFTPQLYDLTLLLGSTIADRLYTLEQSTAGSGIAQLKAWGFDFDEYIPYTAPTLKHVEGVSAHVMRDAEDNIIGNYPLDATLILRGLPKLDANNQLYYDGDTYEPDGTVTRKYAIRAYQSGDESLADAITDGTNTVYKLSTPTTEQATPYTEYQQVDASGTEEYVSTGVVPVGHVTKYPTDLKGKLEQILDGVPTTDGTYVLTATVSSGKATYSWESTSSAKTSVKEPIDTLEKEIVEKPSDEEPVEEVTEEPVYEEQEEEQPVEEQPVEEQPVEETDE